jgi:tRNA nucleotidyltransferase (CCA-adding enzyme)
VKAEPLRRRLQRALGRRWAALEAVVREADDHGVHAYLVGGPVRDLLLGCEIGDLDVLVSGSLERVARAVAARLGGREILHRRFLTAHVDAGPLALDLAQARRERYARAGALPEVEPASLADDFARRDFTIHAMALPLDAAAGGELLDPFDGRRDLAERRLRALHEASFRDDPTRLWRAARYAARLGLRLEPATARWAREAVEQGAPDRVSGARIAAELERTLQEVDPARALAQVERAGLLEAVAPGWSLAPEARPALRRLARVRSDPPWTGADEEAVLLEAALRLALLGSRSRVRARVLDRLVLTGRRRERLEADLRALARLDRTLAAQPSRGAADERLAGTQAALLLLLHCAGEPATRRAVDRWAREDRTRAGPLDGHRARQLGAEGPEVGTLLRAARRRDLDGTAVDDEWARRWLARRRRLR